MAYNGQRKICNNCRNAARICENARIAADAAYFNTYNGDEFMNYYEPIQENTYFNTGNDSRFIESTPAPISMDMNMGMDTGMGMGMSTGMIAEAANIPENTQISPVPETVESTLFIPGFLKMQVGKLMRVEFLVGNILQDRVGILRQVGASYILIQPVGESSMIMCDLFSIRFATIINRPINGEELIIT